MINLELAQSRGLPAASITKIETLQAQRDLLMSEMASSMNDDPSIRKSMLDSFRKNELELQEAWEFPIDKHRAFLAELRISGCCCPFMDNKDSPEFRYISKQCKWHNL